MPLLLQPQKIPILLTMEDPVVRQFNSVASPLVGRSTGYRRKVPPTQQKPPTGHSKRGGKEEGGSTRTTLGQYLVHLYGPSSFIYGCRDQGRKKVTGSVVCLCGGFVVTSLRSTTVPGSLMVSPTGVKSLTKKLSTFPSRLSGKRPSRQYTLGQVS